MKIAVFSDTHGDTSRLEHIISRYFSDDPETIFIHLGDFSRDMEKIAQKFAKDPQKVFAVDGNCDEKPTKPFLETTRNGVKIFAAHGHLYNVKANYDRLFYAAKERAAHVCLFGHTHTPEVFIEEGTLFMNPGSLSIPRGGKPSYGILNIDEHAVSARVIFDFGNGIYKLVYEKELPKSKPRGSAPNPAGA